MKYVDLDTPALLLDQDVFEANIAAMAGFFRDRPANLRAHVKTHKCPKIALAQIDAGAIGVCCQKLGEAEVMCAVGIRDVLVTNQIVGTRKIERLLALPQEADVKVAVDSAENVECLGWAGSQAGREIPVVIELDLGMERQRSPDRGRLPKPFGLSHIVGWQLPRTFLLATDRVRIRGREALP